jgi:hypothetical protein
MEGLLIRTVRIQAIIVFITKRLYNRDNKKITKDIFFEQSEFKIKFERITLL